MQFKSHEELLDWEDDWLSREDLDGVENRAWLEEGIDIYKQLIQIDQNEQRYSITLADLYLGAGRDEKMRIGNHRNAFNILWLATLHAPNKPDAFYHLSFVLAKEKRKWEAVLFYGNEALEKGISGSRRIKLLCNLSLGYARLGYIIKSRALIEEAKILDTNHDNEWFIELFTDQIKVKRKEPVLLKESNKKRVSVSLNDYNKVIESATEGSCVVLDLTKDASYFRGLQDDVSLEQKEAEVLGFLMENTMKSCSKSQIESSIWLDQQIGSATVKRYISSLRRKISKAMGRDDISNSVLVTTKDGYEWKSDIQSYVLR